MPNVVTQVVIKAVDQATATIKSVSKGMEGLQTNMKQASEAASKVGVAFGAIGAAIVVPLGLAVQAAADAQKEMAKFDATLATVAGTSSATRQALLDAAAASVQLGFDDETTANVLGRFYQRTQDLNTSLKLNALTQDIARAKSIDLASASDIVTQVLNGQTRAVKEYTTGLSDNATTAQILARIQERVAGQGATFTKTFAGQAEVLSQQFNNLKETIGTALLTSLTNVVSRLNLVVAAVQKFASANPELFARIVQVVGAIGIAAVAISGLALAFAGITKVIGAASVLIQGVGAVIAFLVTPVGIAVGAIAVLVAAFVFLYTKFEGVRTAVAKGLELFAQAFSGVFSFVTSVAKVFVAIMGKIFSALAKVGIKPTEIIANAFNVLVDFLGNIAISFIAIVKGLAVAFNKLASTLSLPEIDVSGLDKAIVAVGGMQDAFQVSADGVDQAIEAISSGVSSLGGALKTGFTAITGTVTDLGGSFDQLRVNGTENIKNVKDASADAANGTKEELGKIQTSLEDLNFKYIETEIDINQTVKKLKNDHVESITKINQEWDKAILKVGEVEQTYKKKMGDLTATLADAFVENNKQITDQKDSLNDLQKSLRDANLALERQKLPTEAKANDNRTEAEKGLDDREKAASLQDAQDRVTKITNEIKAAKDNIANLEASAQDVVAKNIVGVADQQAATLRANQTALAKASTQFTEGTATLKEEVSKQINDLFTNAGASVGTQLKASIDAVDFTGILAQIQTIRDEQIVKENTAFANQKQTFIDVKKQGDIFANGVQTALTSVGDTTKAQVDRMVSDLDRLKAALSNAKTNVSNATNPNIQALPKLAEGGIVTSPTIALIGESGAEAVIPLSRLSNASQTSSNATTITVNLGGVTVQSQQDADYLVSEVTRRIRLETLRSS